MFKYIVFVIISVLNIKAQSGIVSGSISDSETGLPLEGVNLFTADARYSAVTNKEGEFLINAVPAGRYELRISHVGYELRIESIEVSGNKAVQVEFKLKPVLLNLGEVMVISTLRERIIRDIPLPMEVKPGTEIIGGPAGTVSDALKTEPGISLARDGIWASTVNIRGLSKQNIITMVDGNRIETATNVAAGLSLIDVNDIERVEVIKGAASSLYGSGATGGIVNVITKKGSYTDRNYFNGSLITSYNNVNRAASTNIRLNGGGDRWYAKFSGTLRSASDTRTPEGMLENSQYYDNSISADAGIIPFENHELNFSYQRFSARDVGLPGGDPFPPDAEARYPSELRDMYSIAYTIKNLSASLLNLSAKYFHQLIERRVELIPNPIALVNTSADHETDGIKIQSQWYLADQNSLTAGIDAWQRKYRGTRTREIIPQNRIIGDQPVPDSRYRSIGIFAQDEFNLFHDRLKMTLGGRYDWIDIKNEETQNPSYIITNGNINNSPPAIDLASYPASEISNSSWSLNLGVIYSFSDNLNAALNIARSFRSPNLEERYQYIDLGGNVYLGNPFLEPERGNFFDLGLRYSSPAVTLRGSMFLNLLRDLVVDKEIITDSLYQKQNVGNARLYGFDLGLELVVFKNTVLYSNGALVIGKDNDTGEYLPDIPPINGRIGVRTRLFGIIDADFSSILFADQDRVASGEQTTPGYAVFDLNLGTVPVKVDPVDLQIYAGIENIFDKAYRNHLSTNRGAILIEPGRNIYAKFRIGW